MTWVNLLISFLGVLMGSGLIQFFITRKDNKEDQIQKLQEALKEGLEERESKGRQRYEEHQESIQKINEAILKLTENDTQMKEYMKYVGDELMGLAHDKLVYLTDRYQERGAITLKEKATLEAIYVPYHDGLGGNGDGKTGYEFAMKLPVVTDAQARDMDIEIEKNNRRIRCFNTN